MANHIVCDSSFSFPFSFSASSKHARTRTHDSLIQSPTQVNPSYNIDVSFTNAVSLSFLVPTLGRHRRHDQVAQDAPLGSLGPLLYLHGNGNQGKLSTTAYEHIPYFRMPDITPISTLVQLVRLHLYYATVLSLSLHYLMLYYIMLPNERFSPPLA